MNQEYPHIPQQLLDYRSPKLLEAISLCGEKTIWLAIDKLFEIVSGITQMQPVALLPCLGFDPKNQDHDSLQSLFGVMRSVTMLHYLGFIGITPLPPRQDRKEADLLAKRQDDLFAVEVFRANEDRWRYPGYKFEEYIGRRFRENKQAQLEATITNHGCSKAILVVVFDSKSKALLSTAELQEAARDAFVAMGFPEKTHLARIPQLSDFDVE